MEIKPFKSSFMTQVVPQQLHNQQQQQQQQQSQQVGVYDDVSADEFLVDEFLDLESGFVCNEGEDEGEGVLGGGVFPECEKMEEILQEKKIDFPDLKFPVDDLAELEWVSQFTEDSSDLSLQYRVQKWTKAGTGSKQGKPTGSGSNVKVKNCLGVFPGNVPGKARSKRSRTGGRVWSVKSRPTLSSSSSGGSGYGSTVSSGSGGSGYGSSSCLIFNPNALSPKYMNYDYYYNGNYSKKPAYIEKKKIKRTRVAGGADNGSRDKTDRHCTHCGVTKTPQWREGPEGSKTLCNACGVRYKSGRLLPEYRPAGSPTFMNEVHSNSHRKVLEMRQKKVVQVVEVEVQDQFEASEASLVQV